MIHTRLVRINKPDLLYDSGTNYLFFVADFEIENEMSAGSFGLDVDKDFLVGLFGAAGVDTLKGLQGKTLRFNYSQEVEWGSGLVDNLVSIAPLWKKDGIPFRVDLWREKRK